MRTVEGRRVQLRAPAILRRLPEIDGGEKIFQIGRVETSRGYNLNALCAALNDPASLEA
jgi:hypothetical protein